MKKLDLDNKYDLSLMLSKLLPEFEGPSDSFRTVSDIERIFIEHNLKNRILERSKEFKIYEVSECVDEMENSVQKTGESLFLNFSDFLYFKEELDIYGMLDMRKFENGTLKNLLPDIDIPEEEYTVHASLLLVVDEYNLENKKVPTYFGSFNLVGDDIGDMDIFQDIYSELMMFIHEGEI
ncbi:hypothetical protein [Staphylococcus phage vB_StaM_SA1]|nr:hypothetical protein [Staphylococcus phage vB_StaM_SA1]